eukprot:15392141-Alexandrium_andersonii.AAC.1
MERQQRLTARSVLRAVRERGALAREGRAPRGLEISVVRALDENRIAHLGNPAGVRAIREQQELEPGAGAT